MARRSATGPVGIKVQHGRFAAALVIGTITILALAFNVSQPSGDHGPRISFDGRPAAARAVSASSTATPQPELTAPVEVIVGKRVCERQAAHTSVSQVYSLPTGISLRAVKAVLGTPASTGGNVSTYCATTPEGTTVAIRFLVDAHQRVTSII